MANMGPVCLSSTGAAERLASDLQRFSGHGRFSGQGRAVELGRGWEPEGRRGKVLTATCLQRFVMNSAGERNDRQGTSGFGIPKLVFRGGWKRGGVGVSIVISSTKSKIVRRARRAPMYEDADTYVLMEPGQDEEFVTEEELLARLKSWLVKWPASKLPEDLTRFDSMDEVASHLVDSACELHLGGGLGSIQWFQVRLET